MALRYCSQPGCPTLVPNGRCPVHTREQRVVTSRFQVGATRYDSARWRRTARAFRATHPFCVNAERGDPGCTLVTEELDHIEPHRGDERLFWNPENWQPMCASCHAAKTARETRGASVAAGRGGEC